MKFARPFFLSPMRQFSQVIVRHRRHPTHNRQHQNIARSSAILISLQRPLSKTVEMI
jgi:hypothetical protein